MRSIIFWLLIGLVITSCSINKDIMFKAPDDYTYEQFPDSLRRVTYKISPDDLIEFRLLTNQGFKLIDLSTLNSDKGSNYFNRQNQQLYLVDDDGTVKLPTLGRVKLEGLSIRQAESKLESLYSEYYRGAFVLLNVKNNRVIVSPGDGGAAKVITLSNKNTTLLEVLAEAGGISDRGNAHRVKLIRLDDNGKRHIYEFDLSTISGIKDADIIVQANDIVYVEPMPRVAAELVKNIAPYISLLTSIVLIAGILKL